MEGIDGADGRSAIRRIFEKMKFAAFLEIHGFFGNSRLFWKITAFLEIHGFFGNSRLFWKITAFLEIHGFSGNSRLFWKFAAFVEISVFQISSVQRFRRPPRRYLPITRP
jgi:esterase/lipase